jgi:hypothetical protein
MSPERVSEKGFFKRKCVYPAADVLLELVVEAKGTGSVDIDDITLESVSLEKK